MNASLENLSSEIWNLTDSGLHRCAKISRVVLNYSGCIISQKKAETMKNDFNVLLVES